MQCFLFLQVFFVRERLIGKGFFSVHSYTCGSLQLSSKFYFWNKKQPKLSVVSVYSKYIIPTNKLHIFNLFICIRNYFQKCFLLQQ